VRTRSCDSAVRHGRLRKAGKFLDAANLVLDFADDDEDSADACTALCVLAGIAASDVICCASFGHHALGEDHNEAISLLRSADKDASKHLGVLLGLKTKSGYSHTSVTAEEVKRAGRAAEALVERARRASAG
jgi:hypothetical protein